LPFPCFCQIQIGTDTAAQTGRVDDFDKLADSRVDQRLGPVVKKNRLDPFASGLLDDLPEHVDLHGFLEVDVFRVTHRTRRAAQIARADNIDVHIHCG